MQEAGYEFQPMEESMVILRSGNYPQENNALEEVVIKKATTSAHMLNSTQNINNQLFRILQPLQDQTMSDMDS